MNLGVQFKKLNPDAKIPTRGSAEAAGLDLSACGNDGLWVVLPGCTILVPTGLCMSLPPGYEGQIRPRSGLALKHCITVLNAPGTVDSDYRGEIKVMLINHGTTPVTIHTGDRIAQLVIAKVEMLEPEEVEQLSNTDRGAKGFGSSGI